MCFLSLTHIHHLHHTYPQYSQLLCSVMFSLSLLNLLTDIKLDHLLLSPFEHYEITLSLMQKRDATMTLLPPLTLAFTLRLLLYYHLP